MYNNGNFPVFPSPKYVRIDSTLQNVWSDNYAPFYLACEYAQKELSPDYLVKCYWPHGCYLPVEEFDIDMVTGCMAIPKSTPVFVARSETRDFMVRHGFTNVRSIGLPIVYLPEQEIQRRRNTLIVNPLFPASGLATGSFNGLHTKSKFLAVRRGNRTQGQRCQADS